MAARLDLAEHALERLDAVGLAGRLVPAQPVDAGKAHGEPGFVPGGARQAFERDFEHEALVRLVHDLAHRAEPADRVAPYEPVDLGQLRIGEAEVGFADWDQLVAGLARPRYAECVV